MPDEPSGPSRRSYRDYSVEERLAIADNIVTAYTDNAAFRDGLNGVGTTAALMTSLQNASVAARAADDGQAAAYSTEREAGVLRDETLRAAEAAYKPVYDRARAAGRLDPELGAALDFSPKATNRAQRLAQMAQFLQAVAGYQTELAAYGLTVTEASAARDAAEAASQAWDLRDVEAQRATEQRDAAMGPVDAIVRDLQERGRIAFVSAPQLLEILGLRPIA